MAAREGSARWSGDVLTGAGELTVGTSAWTSGYSGASRLHDVLPGVEAGTGTNPEELLAAAHAACFNMGLSFELTEAGHAAPRLVQTRARVHLRFIDGAPTIEQIDLDTEADAAGLDQSALQELAERAKASCIISRALGGVPHINVAATLIA